MVDAPSPNPHCFLSVKTDQCGAVFCGVLVVLMPLSGSTLHWWRQNSPLVEATSKAAPAAPKPAPTSHPMLCCSSATNCSSVCKKTTLQLTVVLFLINCSVPTSHPMLFCTATDCSKKQLHCSNITTDALLQFCTATDSCSVRKKQHCTRCSAALQSAVEHQVHCSSRSAVVLFFINCSATTSHPMLCSSAVQLTVVLFVKKTMAV